MVVNTKSGWQSRSTESGTGGELRMYYGRDHTDTFVSSEGLVEMRRSIVVCLLLSVVFIALVASVSAKTAVTNSTMPDQTKAGEPFKVTFGTENHDGVSLANAAFQIEATEASSGDTLVFPATRVGDLWEAELTLPSPGVWTFKVFDDARGFAQELPSINVAENPLAPVTTSQLSQALETAQSRITTQVDADIRAQLVTLSANQETLTTQLATLGAEREALAQRVASLETTQVNAPSGGDAPWWSGALLALAVTAMLGLAAGVLLLRRGTLGRLTYAPKNA